MMISKLSALFFVSMGLGCQGDEPTMVISSNGNLVNRDEIQADGSSGVPSEIPAGNPYESISDASPERLLDVAQSYVFVGVLGKLMEGYEPELPVVEDPDLLRCMTDEVFSFDSEMKKLDQSMEAQVRAAEAERDKQEREFYRDIYPVQFRIDHDWSERPGVSLQQIYGCWDSDGYYWDSDYPTRTYCLEAYSFHRWRVKSSRWVEDDSVNLYSRSEEPQRPELMVRIENQGVETRERIHCMVGEVVHPADGPHAFFSCVAPQDSSGLVSWLQEGQRLDPTPLNSEDNDLYTADRITSALNAVSGEQSPVFNGYKGAFSLKIASEEATGVLLGDVVSIPLASVQGIEQGVVFADFDQASQGKPHLSRWTIQAAEGTLAIESNNGTCPPEEEIAAQLCGNFTKYSDRERALEACVLGGQLEPLGTLASEWERARFEEKNAFMVRVYATLVTEEKLTPEHHTQHAAYQLLEEDTAGAKSTLQGLLTKLNAADVGLEPADIAQHKARILAIAEDAEFSDLVVLLTPPVE